LLQQLLKEQKTMSKVIDYSASKIDCSKVLVKSSAFATEDNQFDGAFAAVDFKEGERRICN